MCETLKNPPVVGGIVAAAIAIPAALANTCDDDPESWIDRRTPPRRTRPAAQLYRLNQGADHGMIGAHGWVAEWSNAPVLKTGVGKPTGGSNPSPTAHWSDVAALSADAVFATSVARSQ
jgi:hypothetical protein